MKFGGSKVRGFKMSQNKEAGSKVASNVYFSIVAEREERRQHIP